MSPSVSIATREEVVCEVCSWIGTPYIRKQMVKGAGCDCATLVFATYRKCDLIPDEEIGIFSDDWWAHTDEEKYMKRILRHAYKVAQAISYATLEAKPGNIVLTRHASASRVFNHAGLVTRWPMLVHAVEPKVQEIDATKHAMWCFREVIVFDPWEKLLREAAA